MPVACNSRLLWAWQLTVILKKKAKCFISSVGSNTRRCLSSEVRISPWQQVLLILLTFWCGAAVRRHKVFVISRLQPAQAHRHKARTPTCSLQNFSSFDLLHSAAVASVVPTGSVGHGFLLLRIPRSPRVDASWGQRVKGTARPMLVRYYTLARTQQQQYWHTEGVVRHCDMRARQRRQQWKRAQVPCRDELDHCIQKSDTWVLYCRRLPLVIKSRNHVHSPYQTQKKNFIIDPLARKNYQWPHHKKDIFITIISIMCIFILIYNTACVLNFFFVPVDH